MTTKASAYPPAATAGDEMDESDDDDEGETIRVVPSYKPRVVGTANPQTAMAIDPITGKSVPVADVPEHLRIQLLDPKWAEERKKFQDKQKESNLVTGDAIVSNLSRYSQAKGDLFGKSVSRTGRCVSVFLLMKLRTTADTIASSSFGQPRNRNYWIRSGMQRDV